LTRYVADWGAISAAPPKTGPAPWSDTPWGRFGHRITDLAEEAYYDLGCYLDEMPVPSDQFEVKPLPTNGS
jgi:hypothetical protein